MLEMNIEPMKYAVDNTGQSRGGSNTLLVMKSFFCRLKFGPCLIRPNANPMFKSYIFV